MKPKLLAGIAVLFVVLTVGMLFSQVRGTVWTPYWACSGYYGSGDWQSLPVGQNPSWRSNTISSWYTRDVWTHAYFNAPTNTFSKWHFHEKCSNVYHIAATGDMINTKMYFVVTGLDQYGQYSAVGVKILYGTVWNILLQAQGGNHVYAYVNGQETLLGFCWNGWRNDGVDVTIEDYSTTQTKIRITCYNMYGGAITYTYYASRQIKTPYTMFNTVELDYPFDPQQFHIEPRIYYEDWHD